MKDEEKNAGDFLDYGKQRKGTWVAPLRVGLLILAQVMISRFHEFEPHIGLCTDSAEPDWDSPSLSAPPLLTLSYSHIY